jgi:hypothetical protein
VSVFSGWLTGDGLHILSKFAEAEVQQVKMPRPDKRGLAGVMGNACERANGGRGGEA